MIDEEKFEELKETEDLYQEIIWENKQAMRKRGDENDRYKYDLSL